jgi:hypothetical protein
VRKKRSYRQQAKKESLHDLQGCLMTIHAILVAGESPEEVRQTGLRLTVHVAIDAYRLQQVLDYVGDDRGGPTAGRVFQMQSGIAGRVYRTGKAYAASRFAEDYENYVTQLVETWHYVEQDARKLNPATRAWMAVPLALPGSKIQGILYLDSRNRDYFSTVLRQFVISAASGVARFAAQRYAND